MQAFYKKDQDGCLPAIHSCLIIIWCMYDRELQCTLNESVQVEPTLNVATEYHTSELGRYDMARAVTHV